MPDKNESSLSRREFGAVSVATGLAVASQQAAAALPVMEMDVQVKTPDGTADSVFVHPTSGQHPGVLIWTDAFGLSPAFRAMARRLAGEGYAVLVPNPFYRQGKAPLPQPGLNFGNPDDRAKIMAVMSSVTAAGHAERDATAYLAFLDAQAQVKKGAKIGVQGYCMGGPLTMRTAALLPDRVGAGGSFHGGGLVTANPDSPHLLVPKMKARFYFGVANNDDQQQPDAKDKLREAFAAAKLPAEIEVYPEANHGWCVPGSAVYHEAAAERAWAKLLALYKTALA